MATLGLRRRLIVVVTRFLSLCALLLVLPAVAAAQPAPLAVLRVWMQDAGSKDKTSFAPGEIIQFAAELNNSYGGILASAELTITTSFYNNSRSVDIPAGISTWTWNATAPEHGNYAVTVKAYDSFHRAWAMLHWAIPAASRIDYLFRGWRVISPPC